MNPENDPYVRPPDSIRFIIPFLPPSSNKMYVTDWRRKKRFPSKETKAFVNKFNKEVVSKYLPWISQLVTPEQDPNICYEIKSYIFFDRWDVETKGWFSTPRTAKSRYKKMDTGNRFKLLFDCVAKATDIDDSHFFDAGGRKLIAQHYDMEPQVHVFLFSTDPREYGIIP